jgi:hypothetical protein
MIEKAVLVSPQHGILRTTCEVEDTPDPEVKHFRFRAWPTEGFQSGMRDGLPDFPLRYISVYSHWSEFDVGEKEGSYRVTAKLETPDGYVGAFEGTTKPKPADKPAAPDNRPDAERALKIEDAIMSALEREPRMTLRTLKRKTHAERFGQAWDDCLKSLSDEGELTIENERGLTNRGRTWVALASVTTDSTNDCISVPTQFGDSSAIEE